MLTLQFCQFSRWRAGPQNLLHHAADLDNAQAIHSVWSLGRLERSVRIPYGPRACAVGVR